MKKSKIFFCFIPLIIFILSCGKSSEELAREQKKFEQLISQGDKFFNKSEYLKALNFYLKAEKIDSKDGLLLYKLGFCYYDKAKKKLFEAKRYYYEDNEEKSKQCVKDSLKYFNKAKKYYLKALKFLDTNKNIHYVAATYFNLGVIYLNLGSITKKQKYFEKKYDYFISAYSLLTKIEEMGKANGLDLFRLAYYYMDNKEDEMAIEYYKKAIEKLKIENPYHFYYSGAYFNIGLIYWNKNEINKTLYYWKKALEIDPDNSLYNEFYTKALEKKEELENL